MAKRKQKGATQWADVDGGQAFIIPVTALRHPNFVRLSANACKLVLDLGRQYSGFNNGYLSAAFSILAPCGWKSESTIREAVAECLHYGIILKTRQGGRNRCNLFALTWWRITLKEGRPLDVASTLQPSHEWKQERPIHAKPVRKRKMLGPATGATYHRSGRCPKKMAPLRVFESTTTTAAGAVSTVSEAQ